MTAGTPMTAGTAVTAGTAARPSAPGPTAALLGLGVGFPELSIDRDAAADYEIGRAHV